MNPHARIQFRGRYGGDPGYYTCIYRTSGVSRNGAMIYTMYEPEGRYGLWTGQRFATDARGWTMPTCVVRRAVVDIDYDELRWEAADFGEMGRIAKVGESLLIDLAEALELDARLWWVLGATRAQILRRWAEMRRTPDR